MESNNITALVTVLSTHKIKTEAPDDRRLSQYEQFGEGRVEIKHVLKGTAPEAKKKPLAISFQRCSTDHARYKKGDVLQVEGVIESLTKNEDIFYATRVCVPTEAGERAIAFTHNMSAQDKRNELVRKDQAFLLADEEAGVVPNSRQDLLSLTEFLRSHGFNYDVEMAYLIDGYFKRRMRNRKSYDSVSDMVQANPLVLGDLYCEEKSFSPTRVIQAFHVKPSEKARIYAKAVSFINLQAYHGDTFVPMSKLFGFLSEDLKGKPRNFLHDVLMDFAPSEAYTQSMAYLSFFSPKNRFIGMSEDIISYFQQKLDMERPDELEKNERTARFTFEKPAFYMIKNFFGEKNAAKYLAKRLGREENPLTDYTVSNLFTEEQKLAVQKAFDYKTSVITGSAGCGKTRVISEIVRIARDNKRTVIVLAPSAKAALHAASEVGNEQDAVIPYKTIHRFAKILPEDADAGEKGDYLPSDSDIAYDFVIIDEMSMANLSVFHRVLKVLADAKKTHLILVGDPMQLPAIGAQFFHQLADGLVGDILPVSHLTKNFRAHSDSLASFGEEVRAGRFEIPEDDHIFFEESNLKEFIKKHEAILADDDTMFLAPRKEEVAELNQAIRKVRHPNAKEVTDTFYIGDRIVTQQNDYAESEKQEGRHPDRVDDIYNGTDGILESYDETTDTASVRMFSPDFPAEGKIIPYRKKELAVWMLPAFAETVHKAQGSQFHRVVFFLSDKKGGVGRNLLYTAITRAEKELCLIGSKQQFEEATRRMSHYGNSFLAFRVREELEQMQDNPEPEEVGELVFSI